MTRFDSCGTYQVSERSVAVFFTGNDLVSERVDLLTHLPAIHSRRIRFHRRFEDSRLCWPSRSGRGILFNCYLRNFARTVRVEFRGSARNLNILPSIISSLLLRQSSPFILKSSHSNLWINNLLVYVENRLCIKTRRYSVLLDASCIEGCSIYPLPEF